MPSLRRSACAGPGSRSSSAPGCSRSALPASVEAGSGRFVDDDGSRYESSIEAVARAGIMTACNPPRNDRFCPKARRQPRRDGRLPRPDVPPHGDQRRPVQGRPEARRRPRPSTRWSRPGSPTGCSKRRFCPDAAVTRGRMAVFVTRALKLTATSGVRFDDVPASHTRSATAIDRLATAGLAISCGSRPLLPEPRHHAAPRPPASSSGPAPSPGSPRRSRRRATRTAARRPARRRRRRHVVARPRDRQRDAGELHRRRRSSAPSPRAASSRSTAARSRSTIKMAATAKVFNDKPDVVLDGGGLVTLDGQDARRILYMNTCDPASCGRRVTARTRTHPTLTVQNLAFANGRSTGHRDDGRRRRDLRPRRAVPGGQRRLLRQPLRVDRARHRRRVAPGLLAVRRPAGVRRQQHLRRLGRPAQRVLECRRHLEHRRVVDDPQQRVHGQPGDRQRAPTRRRTASPAAATAGRSTTTATR